MLQTPSRASSASSSSFQPVSRQNTMSSVNDGSRSARQSKRYSSVTALYMSMSANERDLEIEDDLAKAQKILRELKSKISSQSKKNFVLEKDVRYLDSRIALLIQNRMALEEQNEVASHLEDAGDLQEGFFPNDEKTQKYGNLLFLLQSEPRHIAHLCRLVTMAEIDALLQTVMFTIYGNQYESREEHLLLTMFQSVLTYQFDNTPEYSSLLRANTPVSRMMTTYTRRGPGQSYLKAVLADRINGLIELRDLDLEINPLKVYEKMIEQIEEEHNKLPDNLPRGVTAEQAAENPQVQAIIEPRLGMLMEIANGFLTTIIDGLEETPYGIRWICKQIRSLTKRKYPDANDQIICTLIGGFFFLRFINPAIVTPKSYMLIEGTPAEKPRRTLTLIAKMLQNLANKPSYGKEPYMAKLQPFIQGNKERINKFMLDLCEVQDFYESLEMDNYVALSKKDLELSITLNEVYATHTLLDKHRVELNKDDNSHLAVILSELGPAPAQLPRKDNRAINLPLFSKWETAIDDLTAALDITQEEVFFMEAKSTFVQIMRSIPGNPHVARRPLRLEKVADAAATSRNDAVMVRKGIRAMELLSQLQEMRVIDRVDGFATLRDEIEQELHHLGSLKDGVVLETEKLDEVFKTIRDHNTYLVNQLETYKSYLHNVRGQAEGTRRKQQQQKVLGPYKFTHQQLEKEGVIQKSNVPDNRRANIYFNFTSPLPGTFVISLHYKGRNRGLLELDLKLDDLLEMQKDGQEELDLEYVQFNVPKVLALLNKRFTRKKGWKQSRALAIQEKEKGSPSSAEKASFIMPAIIDDPTTPTIYRRSGTSPFPDPHDPQPSLPPDLTPRQVTLRDRTTIATIVPFSSRYGVPPTLLQYLSDTMNKEIEGGDTYPMMDNMTTDAFSKYWFQNFGAVMLLGTYASASAVTEGHDWATQCLGSFYIKPNYTGRSSHISNAGFLVTDSARNRGVGRLMGEAYLAWAPLLGYTYSVFNLVYETNVASCRIWDALGFKKIGRVPGCGNLRSYPDRLVDAIIYGRELGGALDEQAGEERFDKIRFYLKYGTYPHGADRAEKSRLRSAATHYRLREDDVLMLKGREVVPEVERQWGIAREVHERGHGGINRTTTTIAESFHWVRIKETVSDVIRNCKECKDKEAAKAVVPAKRKVADEGGEEYSALGSNGENSPAMGGEQMMAVEEDGDVDTFHDPPSPVLQEKALAPPHQMDGEPYYTALEYEGQTSGAFQTGAGHGEMAQGHLHDGAAGLELDPRIMGGLREEFAMGFGGLHDGGHHGFEEEAFHLGQDVGRGRKWEG
ncbi:hypothetical protein VE00_01666 [Pseudogymnoascus sp. WSF 3629]|nr:hypothetical protein VE00_01666 [Pseudogymnoascus sp. WSF 3629]